MLTFSSKRLEAESRVRKSLEKCSRFLSVILQVVFPNTEATIDPKALQVCVSNCVFIWHIFILPTFLWDPGLRSPPLCLKSLKSSEFIFHLINIPDCRDSSLSACIWVLIPHALFAQVWQVTRYFSEEFIDNNHNSHWILTKLRI